MISKLFFAWGLMALCVVIHAGGLTLALRSLRRRRPSQGTGALMALFITVAGVMVLLHTIEIAVWAFFYVWQQALPDLDSSFYFSAVTYTTTGYGDVVLPPGWRLFDAVEALTGILLSGLSTGFFFAVVSQGFTQTATAVEGTR